MSQETVPIIFEVQVGKPDGNTQKFSFPEQAPAFLCKPRRKDEPHPDPDAEGVFTTALIKRHYDEVMKSQEWYCVICKKPTARAYTSVMSGLAPSVEAIEKGAKADPVVLGIWAPACSVACSLKAAQVVKVTVEDEIERLGVPAEKLDSDPSCNRCGKITSFMRCPCNILGYCSKECQRLDWPLHKGDCKRVRREGGGGSGA